MVDLLIVVATGEADAGDAGDLLSRHGAASVEHRSWGRGHVIVSGGPFEAEAAAAVAALVRAAGWPADVRPTGGGHLMAWQTHTAPTVVSDRLWVCFPWSEFDRDRAPLLVDIDPVRAFGTGAHPSTLLILRWLADHVTIADTVLDVGCGSGVLAVAAAVLGARRVTAVDIDPAAVFATLGNATRNRVTIDASAQPVPAIAGLFDVVVANIGAATLVELSDALADRVAPGGHLVLSGMSPAQISRVAAAFPGMELVESPAIEDWSAAVLRVAPVS